MNYDNQQTGKQNIVKGLEPSISGRNAVFTFFAGLGVFLGFFGITEDVAEFRHWVLSDCERIERGISVGQRNFRLEKRLIQRQIIPHCPFFPEDPPANCSRPYVTIPIRNALTSAGRQLSNSSSVRSGKSLLATG